jgi:hypothetical protein
MVSIASGLWARQHQRPNDGLIDSYLRKLFPISRSHDGDCEVTIRCSSPRSHLAAAV